MAKLTNYQLWGMGTPLADAWLEFASEADKAAQVQMQNLYSENNPERSAESGAISKIFFAISSGLNTFSEINKLHNSMKESLLTDLYNNQFQAFAYRVAPSVSRYPVRIDCDAFRSNDPDWSNETLDARGYRYLEIRIVDPSKIPDAAKPRRGRIGSGTIIRRTIAEMISEGFDICSVDRQIACNEIIKRIGNNYPKGSGLTPQNLRKYILEKCSKRNIE